VEDFKIDVKASASRSDVVILTISGELDVHTVPEMDKIVKEQFGKNVTRMVFDLSGLTYTSSAGIGIIMSSIKFARGKGGDIKLASLQPRVHRVLELLGFTKIFEIYDSEPAASAAF
jgi:anti-sigma B factor antagonist